MAPRRIFFRGKFAEPALNTRFREEELVGTK
jgi:hypothetical protein